MTNLDKILAAITFTAFILFLLLGCATRQNVLELGAGYDVHVDSCDHLQSAFSYRNEPKGGGNGWVLDYTHNSHIRCGWPFNEKEEDLTDQYSIKYRWIF